MRVLQSGVVRIRHKAFVDNVTKVRLANRRSPATGGGVITAYTKWANNE